MTKLKIDDWVLIGNDKVGQLWDIRGSFGIVQMEVNGLSLSNPFFMGSLTRIPKEVADIMRAV